MAKAAYVHMHFTLKDPTVVFFEMEAIVKKLMIRLLLLISVIIFSACAATGQAEPAEAPASEANIEILTQMGESQLIYILPPYAIDGNISVEKALANRRSHRNFRDKAISADQLSQILWAAYGITSPMPDVPHLRGGLRTTPSAGALYPLEIYVIIGNVEEMAPGIYKYISDGHKLIKVAEGDVRHELSEAALGQRMIREAPVSVLYSAVFSRMTARYGERGIRYTYIELGHSAQNIYLQAEALGLGTVAVGAFNDDKIKQILNLPADEEPLYIMPIGYHY